MVVVEAGHPVPGHDAVPADSVVGEPGEDQGNLGGRWPPAWRIDDQHAIETSGDVLGQWGGVTVIGMQPGRSCDDLVSRLAAGWHRFPPILLGPMCPVEVDVVRVAGVVLEMDPEDVALRSPQDRGRHGPVVGPRLDMGARAHLDEALLDRDLDVTHRPWGQAVGWRREGEPIEGIGTYPGRWRIDIAVQIRGALLVHG